MKHSTHCHNIFYRPRLPVRAQLWAWLSKPVGGIGDADDARVSGRLNATALLPAVCRRLGAVPEQTRTVGTHPRNLPPISSAFPASDLRSHASEGQATAASPERFVAGLFCWQPIFDVPQRRSARKMRPDHHKMYLSILRIGLCRDRVIA